VAAPTYHQKLAVLVAGCAGNLILAVVLAVTLWIVGYPQPSSMRHTMIGYVPPTVMVNGKEIPNPVVRDFKAGDEIKSINSIHVANWGEISSRVLMESKRTADGFDTDIAWRRGESGFEKLFALPADAEMQDLPLLPVLPAERVVIDKVFDGPNLDVNIPESPIDSFEARGQTVKIYHTEQLRSIIQTLKVPETVTIIFSNGMRRDMRTFRRDEDKDHAYLGIQFEPDTELAHIDPYTQLKGHLVNFARTMYALFRPNSGVGVKHLSGPVGIAHTFFRVTQVNWRYGIWLGILLNINLAVLNLLPLPVLDGGHIMFATIEKLLGRPVPAKIQVKITTAVVAMLLSLVLVVTFFDVIRLFS
jgi:regulator of sigma E protease